MITSERPLKVGEWVELTIESAGFEGKSVARKDGFVIFIPGGIPGDRVKVKIKQVKSAYANAQIESVIQRGPHYTEPRCTHTASCGGCKWQHMAYSQQLAAKEQQVRDIMLRIGGLNITHMQPILGVDDPFFYRNKMEFSFSANRWLEPYEITSDPVKPKDFALGLFAPGRFDKIIDIDACYLQSPLSNQILAFTRQFVRSYSKLPWNIRDNTGFCRNLVIRQAANTDDLMVVLVTSDYDKNFINAYKNAILDEIPAIKSIVNIKHSGSGPVPRGEGEWVVHGRDFLTEKLHGIEFRIHPLSFFQTNTRQAEKLFKTAFEAVSLKPTDVLLDLYCGPGTISLLTAGKVKSAIGIELVPESIDNAKENSIINQISNVDFHVGDVKKMMTDSDQSLLHETPSVIVVDPPRAGLHEEVANLIPEMKADRILYISCNPSTQARDLKIMVENQPYEISFMQPVDMFPHTFHIENIAVLKRI